MKKRSEKKIVVVFRETRIDGLRKRFNSIDQLSFLIEKRGGRIEDYLDEDRTYKQAVARLETSLSYRGRVQFLDRGSVVRQVSAEVLRRCGVDADPAVIERFCSGHDSDHETLGVADRSAVPGGPRRLPPGPHHERSVGGTQRTQSPAGTESTARELLTP